MLYIDMHAHSVSSDDARATVEQYLKWVRTLCNRGYQVDGIVLTEHRKFDRYADYSELARRYGILVFRGSEVDTRYGHFLVYGVSDQLLQAIDFSDVQMDPAILMEKARASGGIAVPAHPGRAGIGLVEWMRRGVPLPPVRIVERLNGGNRPTEAEAAEALVQEKEYLGIGGSDAHFVSNIARCLTGFPDAIRTEQDLVESLLAGGFRAVQLEETRE